MAMPSASARPGRGRIYGSITATIGDTPLVRLNRLPQMQGIKAQILAKLEKAAGERKPGGGQGRPAADAGQQRAAIGQRRQQA